MPLATPPNLPQAAIAPRKKSMRGGYKIDRRHPLASGLVAAYLMAEGTGSTIRDLASGLNGTGAGSAGSINWTTANPVGSCLTLDGSTGYVELTPIKYSWPQYVATAEIWVNTSSPGSSYRRLVVLNGVWGLYLKDSVIMAYNMGPGYDISTGINVADGKWHQIVYTFTHGGACQFYLDGVLIYTSSASASGSTYDATIGGATAGSQCFGGLIDKVNVWNRVLSASEIAALYRQGRNGGLQHFWVQPSDAARVSALSTPPAATSLALDTYAPYRLLPLRRTKGATGSHRINRQHPQARNLIAHYQMSERTGPLHDMATGATGTFSGSAGWNYSTQGSVVNFAALTDKVTCPTLPVGGTTNYTLSAWFLANSWGTGEITLNCIVTQEQTASPYAGFFLRCYQGLLYFTIINAAGTSFDTTISVPSTGVWHHCVGTYDGANVRMYLDGVQVAVNTGASGAIFAAAAPMTIGDSASYPGRCLDGQVSMVTAWGRTLPAQEIADLYRQTMKAGLPAFIQHPTDAVFLSTASVGQAFVKALTETLALADSRQLAAAKSLSDTLALADVVTKGGAKGLVESLTLTDTRSLAAARKLLESLTLTDAGVSAILTIGGSALTKMLTESLSLSDGLGKGAAHKLTETLALSDALGKGAARKLLESLNISDTRLVGVGKQIAESLSLTDARSLALVKNVVEQLGLTDNLNTLLAHAALYLLVQIIQSSADAGASTGADTSDDNSSSGGQA